MDVEVGKDDISVEDGDLVVFTGIEYRINNGIRRSCCIKKKDPGGGELVILNGAYGALRPGRLTFILGPSGAGKTTLLNILAGRKKTGVTGILHGAGRKAVLVAQHATLIDALTAGETLRFAASLKLPNSKSHERCYAIEAVSTQLGIKDVLNTRASRLSGGERKRLTIACELLTDPSVMLLDEPTSGLDSVSSMSVTRALRTVASSGRTIACVVHQPSSKLFSSADDVILLAGGRTLYAGSVEDVPDALARAGLTCPQYYNMADFLLEVATEEHKGNLALLENEAKSYSYEMKRIAKNEIPATEKDSSTEAEALLSTNSTHSNDYAANIGQQMKSLLWRGIIGVSRDVHLTQIRLAAHLMVALLLGALYNGAGVEAGRIISNSSCVFFFLLFLYFSNAMPTIHTFPVEATVVLQEHLNGWYSVITYCTAKILVDMPMQFICATVFILPAWYLTSQPIDYHRMGLAWVVCILITVLAQSFGLVVGAACGVKLGLFLIPAANIPMLMFTEFFIPYNEMPLYLRPIASISYFRYAFDAFLQTVYGFNRERLPCNNEYCVFKNPIEYLEYLGLSQNYVRDIWALLIWIWGLQILLVCVLLFRVHKACR